MVEEVASESGEYDGRNERMNDMSMDGNEMIKKYRDSIPIRRLRTAVKLLQPPIARQRFPAVIARRVPSFR
jgi:hypothetical protein